MLSGADKFAHLVLMGSRHHSTAFKCHSPHTLCMLLSPALGGLAWACLHIQNTNVVGSLLICRLITAAQHCHCCKSYYDLTHFLLLQEYCEQQGVAVQSAVDAACAAGLSTRSLADRFPGAKVQGLDLSPHFLALAELRRR